MDTYFPCSLDLVLQILKQGCVKVFPELSNKNSEPSGGFEIHDPTVTLKKESVQEIVVETRITVELSKSARVVIYITGCK